MASASSSKNKGGRPSLSAVLSNFEQISQGEYRNRRMRCKWCKAESCGNSTRQSKHLKTCGPYLEAMEKKMRPQSLITSHVHVHDKSFKATANRMAAEAIFADGRSFRLLESPLMKRFLRILNPTFNPPDHKAVAKQLPSIYRTYKETVQSHVGGPFFQRYL
jgi:hypothetical protein